MKLKKVLLSAFLIFGTILWVAFWISGIARNYKHYGFLDYIIVIIVFLLPFAILIKVSRNKKNKKAFPIINKEYQNASLNNGNNTPIAQNTNNDPQQTNKVSHLVRTSDNQAITVSSYSPILQNNLKSNYEISPIAQFVHIPKEIIDLLWISSGPLKNYSEDVNETNYSFAGFNIRIKTSIAKEPSAIDINLPLAEVTSSPARLDYYPSYERLTPQERTHYLNWLTNITAPIDIGYVFIFYYGLERHLFFGNAEGALETIFLLRQHHSNGSFLGYSENAVLLYILIHKRMDLLKRLDTDQLYNDAYLFVIALVHQSFSAKDIMRAYKKFGFENNRYIKNEAKLFLSTLENFLMEKYGTTNFPISSEDFASTQGKFQLALANYSLLPEQRFWELPDITTAPRIHDEINSLLVKTHETVKIKLREQRKDKSNQFSTQVTEYEKSELEEQRKQLEDLGAEKYQILGNLDHQTCSKCGKMDGKVFDVKDYKPGVTAPPFCDHCRCTVVPYLDSDLWGDEEGERIARDKDGNTYYVPGNVTYSKWKKTLQK